MELEKFEEVYQVLEAQKEKDETAAELYADVKEFAYKYATMRYRFSEMSREEKAENDSYRTSQHNRFMDSVRIYFRYLQNNGVNVPDISKLEADRKILVILPATIFSALSVNRHRGKYVPSCDRMINVLLLHNKNVPCAEKEDAQ